MRRILLCAAVPLTLAACGADEEGLGTREPLVLRTPNAQFVQGKLPGTPPGAPGGEDARPAITTIDFTNQSVAPGQVNKDLRGRATDDAVAVGLKLEKLGTGYWVVPVGVLDSQYPGEITWAARGDFSPDIDGGIHQLLAVGIDKKGKAGGQRSQLFCFLPRVPDNRHACDPSRPLPEAVVTLRWNAPVDLDLQTVTPTGRVVSAKNPLVEAPPADDPFGELPVHPEKGAMDRDSGVGCSIDPLQQESLVFMEPPSKGVFTFYVNLFAACGAQGVSYEFAIWRPKGAGDQRHLESIATRTGRLTSFDENGGAGTGQRIVSIKF